MTSSATSEIELEWEAFGRTIENFIDSLQVPGQLSEDKIVETLKFLETKIVTHKMAIPLCQKITNSIINYLKTMKPEGELEEMCTTVLIALGSYCPGMVTFKLWDKCHKMTLPPRSLLIAMGKLSPSQGMATYIGSTWEYILPLLRMTQRDNDMLALCEVLSGLAISAQKHLDLRNQSEKVMDISPEALSIKACQTLRVLFNRWPLKNNSKVTEQALVVIGHLFFLISSSKLKNQVNWLTRRLLALTEAKLEPFYISQCIYNLLGALAVSGNGGVNLASQLENIVDMLFKQMNEKVDNSDPYTVKNYSFTLKTFCMLVRLYCEPMVLLLLKALESMDPIKISLTLHIFTCVFWEVPQTEKLKSKVINSVIIVVQEDFEMVRMNLLHLIEKMAQCGYLALPQGNVIINYLVKLSEPQSSEQNRQTEEAIQKMCAKILWMVPLPQLVNLVCHPNNILAFVPLSKTVTEMALRAQSQGQAPYLSNFHLKPTQFISPQKLLAYLVLLCVKPFKEKDIGASSLRLLNSLHPITSLHPVIHSHVGQLWMKEIPKMLRILDENTGKKLNKKKWESGLLQFVGQSLMAINDENWLEQLIKDILDRINYFNDEDEEMKPFLYKLFGFILRISRDPNLVKTMLSSILETAHEELLDREGIAVAFSIVSLRHLRIALDKLQDYGTILTNKWTSPILKLPKEHQQREWGLVCHTIYLSYSKIILETKSSIFTHLDAILALILQHYHNCIVKKDRDLKLDYLNSLDQLTQVLNNLPITWLFPFPHKVEIVIFMMVLIKEEPLNSVSSCIRQKAMNIVANFRHFKPLLDSEVRTKLLQTCYMGVLSLPSIEEDQANENIFMDTLQSLLKLMEALIAEMPEWIQNCIELLGTWMNSQKEHERERAMWCAARILGFLAKMDNFQMEIKFTYLGKLVKLLALRCQDSEDNICFLSSQAVYNLYCILLTQRKTERKKQGFWEEEGKNEFCSANLFYNNTFEIAKAFAQYFTDVQLTNLLLMAIKDLTNSRAKVSLAAAQLMSAVMQERGKDMIKVEEVVEGIIERLNSELEPSTEEEILRAMCSLAGNNTHSIVFTLLTKPLPWDRTTLALWKIFGTQQQTTLRILQMFISILEKNQSKQESKEMAFKPVAVTCALCEMLSGSQCQASVQELYPRLLLAVLTHLYWVIEQNVPLNMVVYNKEVIQGKSKSFDPTSCALEVVKLVFLGAAYEKVVVYANQHNCWDLLSSPQFYYIGIINLVSGIVINCELHILHRILNLVRRLLYNLDDHRRILARTVYAQLLWHKSVAQTLGHDFLGNLIKWTKESSLIMKEIGLRGISNLALHRDQSQNFKSLVPFLRNFLNDEARVTVQAVKSLRNIIHHGQGEDTKVVFCSISKQLRPLINDERNQVRVSTISALRHMLHQVNKFKPGTLIRKEIYSFLVPLLLSIQDNNAEVIKVCGGTLSEWTTVFGWSALTQMFENTTLGDHIQVVEETCKYLVSMGRKQLIRELLSQSFTFLKNPQPFLRTGAIMFIGMITQRISLNHLHEDDMVILRNAFENLTHDPEETIRSLATTMLRRMDICTMSEPAFSSTLSRLITNFLRVFGLTYLIKKKRIFNVNKQEEDYDSNQKKKGYSRIQLFINAFSNRHHRKIKSTPFIIDTLYEASEL